MRNRMLPLCLMVLVGCGGAATLGGSSPEMVYAVPGGGALIYDRSDSMSIAIDAPGMGSITVVVGQLMTLGMTFASSGGGTRVRTSIERLAASLTNPLSGPVMLTEADVHGVLVVQLDSRGRAEVIETPTVADVGGLVFNVTTLAHELLPKLPPPGTMIGGTWVDTTSYVGADAPGSIEMTWIGTSRLVGDTLVDGRPLSLVRTDAEVTIEVTGTISGMEATQSMAGPETGFYLWDRSRRALVTHEVQRDLTGSSTVSALPTALALTAKLRRSMRLIGG